MRILAVVTVVLFTGLLLFMALNWGAFSAPAVLSLGLAHFEAPVGLFMFGVTVVMSLVYLAFAAAVRTGTLVEGRRQSKEVADVRRLASETEASRITQLAATIAADRAHLESLVTAEIAGVSQRIGASEAAMLAALEDVHNRMAASLGEVEDRLEQS